MSIKQLIISLVLSISVLIGDYRLQLFEQIKFFGNVVTAPLHLVVDIPMSAYEYLAPRTESPNLEAELLQLRAKLQKYNTLLLENQRLLNLAGNDVVLRDESFNITRILSSDKSRLRKHITISHGLHDDVTQDDIVIGEYGVIGIIHEVGVSTSVVRLITDPLQYIPVINTRSGEKSIAKGLAVSEDRLVIQFVRPDADVKVNDEYATSGEGLMFGYGYLVGKVVDINATNDDFLNVMLSPSQEIDKTIFAVIDKSHE